MTAKAKRKPFAERLKDGLTEAVGFAKGELTLRTVQIPEPPPEIAENASASNPQSPIPNPSMSLRCPPSKNT
jgi:hypothetical protein